MNPELAPLSFERLLDWMRRERAATRTLFGLHEDLFHDRLAGRPFALRRRGATIDAPLGVAAGPHTQLSHNLVAAWLCGARFLELKTVQVMDELDIARPCIDMADEGYNCEWSQELPIAVSGDQYLDAWAAIRLLQAEAGIPDAEAPGFAMDLSVGYDLAGIRGAKVQGFLDRMQHSRAELAARLRTAASHFPGAADVEPADRIADSVTLSTMHGCPPEEIEGIATFLLAERGLHTSVKLNPTLLGPEAVRGLLNDTLGFATDVPDEAFASDLAWDEALDLIRSLAATATKAGRSFGVKLGNTLACRNTRGVFPEAEPMMYMSGRALHPIAVATCARLQEACGGALDISFAGGADARNFPRLVACGLGPVTVCSDLLRPGGFQRLHQYLDELASAMGDAPDLAAYARREAGGDAKPELANLRRYAEAVAAEPAYVRDSFPDRTIKTARPLAEFDCIAAPCVNACPASQDVPEYLFHAARGDEGAALDVILRDNPFPRVTGMVCDHPCLDRCTRVNYEGVVRIRDVKRTLSRAGVEAPTPVPAPPTGHRVAIVGAGPAGLSCAYALELAGVATTVFEAKARPGGMITDAIPAFRLEAEDFAADLRRIEAAGVTIRTGESVAQADLPALAADYEAVLLAIGEQHDRALGIPGEELDGVQTALPFLSAALRGELPAIGSELAVVGGGNTAMDVARTAVRLVPPGGKVHIVYRRRWAQMPADREELQAIRDEGVIVHELLSPTACADADGRVALRCERMRLGAPDDSGRPRPEATGEEETLVVDAVVTAIGQALAGDVLARADRPAGADAPLPHPDNVFVAGDALHGAASLIEAIADGRRAADAMLRRLDLPLRVDPPPAPRVLDDAAWQDRAARLLPPTLPSQRRGIEPGDFDLVVGELSAEEARAEAARCLDCSIRCDVCVQVCPNRANLVFASEAKSWALQRVLPADEGHALVPDGEFVLGQARQTFNVADFCNACGNCTTFCPTAGEPFRDKPRIALTEASYAAEDRIHLLDRAGDALRIRRREDGREESLTRRGDTLRYETPAGAVELDPASFAVKRVDFGGRPPAEISLRRAAALAVLLAGLSEHPALIVEEN